MGLAPLAFGPIGLIAARKNPMVRTLAILSLLLLIAWFVTRQESRFLIHVYVLSAIVSLIGWRHLQSRGTSLALALARAVVAISLGYGLFMIGKGWPENVRAVISPLYAASWRSAGVPFVESFDYLNGSNDVTRVLILDRSIRPFYLNKDYVKPVGQWGERTIPGIDTPLEALAKVRELRVSHVLDVNSEISSFQVAPRSGLTLVFNGSKQEFTELMRLSNTEIIRAMYIESQQGYHSS